MTGPARLLGAVTAALLGALAPMPATPTSTLAAPVSAPISAPAAVPDSAPVAVPIAAADDQAVPVSGADRPGTTAPRLDPGRYVDTFSRGGIGEYGAMGTTKYYVIDARPGVHPYVSVTLSPPDADPAPEQLFGVEVTLLDSTSDVCTATAADDVPVRGRHQPVIAVLNGPVFGDPDANASCPTDELAVLQVNRIGEAFADQPLAAEIVVRMEPPADRSGLPGPAPAGADLPAPAHGTPTDLAGGRSFAQAPVLVSGATHHDTITTGEDRYYRIPLSWGQRFAYSVTEIGPADPLLGAGGAEVTADVFNPVRELDGFASTGSLWFGPAPGATLEADTDYAVRYTNRDDVLQAVFALDGDYYLRLSANRSAQPSRTDFLLTVTIDGQPQTGPTYLAAQPGDPSVPAGSLPARSSPDGPSGSPGAGSPAGAPTAQADPVRGGVPAWGWWAGAAMAVAASSGLILALRARRRPDQAARRR